MSPKNQTSRDSDPCDHYVCGRHQTRPPRAVKDRLEPGALDEIVSRFADGSRQVDLAAEYDISLSTVKRILRRFRIDVTLNRSPAELAHADQQA
jgi:DNA invertase Pin-like site-specific DNA recombinase